MRSYSLQRQTSALSERALAVLDTAHRLVLAREFSTLEYSFSLSLLPFIVNFIARSQLYQRDRLRPPKFDLLLLIPLAPLRSSVFVQHLPPFRYSLVLDFNRQYTRSIDSYRQI